jgi:hypothetical protein
MTQYTPQEGSLPDRVIRYFRSNMAEELLIVDIVQKFGVQGAAAVTPLLQRAVNAQWLQREVQNGRVAYSAGQRLRDDLVARAPHQAAGGAAQPAAAPAPPPAVAPAPPPAAQSHQPDTPKRKRAVRVPLPHIDFAAVPVERVPMPTKSTSNGRRGLWEPLFDRLTETGLASGPLPEAVRGALGAAALDYGRKHGSKFAIRKVSEEHIRIWRTQ